ncbi:MAG: cell division protein FtsQ/DivIB [Burkholderiaceae bacterium]
MKTALPLDIRLTNMATMAMIVVLLAMGSLSLGAWVLRHPVWTIRGISVQGDVVHQNTVSLRSQLATQLRTQVSSSILDADLRQVRALFESVSWVRRAQVQREFPNRLKVTLEEHVPVAWWGQAGSGQLVNTFGEVFEAMPDDSDDLPELAGPQAQSAQIWAAFQQLRPELAGLDMVLERLELNDRGNWRARLDSGAYIELGRGTPDMLLERARLFTGTVGQLTQRYAGAIQTVDMRYPNGYALRLQGVTTLTDAGASGNTR